jgi:hypothetical protein
MGREVRMSPDADGVVDPYAPPRVLKGSNASGEQSEAIGRAELEAFTGRNGRVYWDLLGSAVGSRSPFVGFNVAAAALPGPWLLYRKMYLEFVLATVLVWLVRLGLVAGLGGDEVAQPTLAPAYLLLAGAVGAAGNGLYLRRIRSAVLRLRSSEPDPGRRLTLLAKRGGTSIVAPLLVVLVAGAFVVIRRMLAAQ